MNLPWRVRIASFAPGAVVLGVGYILSWIRPIHEEIQNLLPAVPYLLLAAGLFLGWRFHRGRVAQAILLLTLLERALYSGGPASPAGPPSARAVYHTTSVLLPLGLALLHRAREQGLFARAGLVRLGLILLTIPLLIAVYDYPGERWLRWMGYPLFVFQGGPPLSVAAWGAYGLGFVQIGRALYRRRSVMDGAFLWTLLATLAALATRKPVPVPSLFLMAANLILILAVVELSFALAYRDELTGLPARRALAEAFLTLEEPYALALVDIDHFKAINDRYGHDVGDQVLRMIAVQLSRVGGGGQAFRYGGEEFAVLFPGLRRDVAVSHIERVRQTIAKLTFVIRGRDRPLQKPTTPPPVGRRERIQITVSAGVAQADEPTEDPRRVLRRADRALYRAKHEGRNRTCT